MKITKRILSTLLAVIMMLGALAAVITIPAAAAPTASVSRSMDAADIEEYYLNTVFNTPEEKLATMAWMYSDASGRYELYADANTGEVACLDVATGNILFTNPYDVATIRTPSNRPEVLSQVTIVCEDNAGNKKTLNSFTDAALQEQIKVTQIKKGIRVEYTIGREDTKKLVPMLIMGPDFEEAILQPLQEAVDRGEMTDFEYKTFTNRWNCHDIQNMKPYLRADWLTKYPFLVDAYNETGVYPDLWIFRENVSAADIQKTEDTIKKYTDYSYEQLDAHHESTDYEATDALYPAFKLALEYYADENGMSVRMPCNGLRYDMANFKIESISILPYIGAGNYTQDGYAFFPDGSGALFDYETMEDKNFVVTGQVYGEDYAYHQLNNMKYERVVRYPVYGAVSTETFYEYTYSQGGEMVTKKVSATAKTPDQILSELDSIGADLISSNFDDPLSYKRGYLAIIEEGESLTKIKLEHGQSKNKYCTMRNYFKPLATDKNENGVPLSSRKYTGSLSIRFVMLCDDKISAVAKQQYPSFNYYSASWMGMAKAYREYLDQIGVLDPLTEKEVEEDIPLYIESFGALETQETIATIPVYLMTPLTTFDNVLSMYNELSKKDVKNINFKMTGFANGGMYYKVPSALKWEKAVGGKDGFSELVSEAKKINKKTDGSHLGLYPDFDFAYIQENTLFDSVRLKKDAVKTMDNRYTSYVQYSPTQQTFVTFYQLAISPSRYSKFYTKLLENYAQYGIKSLSVASLGNTLNSDFDEDDPYNREESKDFTTEALAYMNKKGYSIMTDGGNAYTWKYVDHILNVDLDSSRYLESSASVPFIGTVLHGYVQFAGAPLNEEGDANYAMLRAIENGASLYFILSYQNTAELKNDPVLSQYYSIRYDIWVDDVVTYYSELNNALKDVQTKHIINHEFLVGDRILDIDELQKDIDDRLEDAAKEEDDNRKNEYISGLVSVSDAWNLLYEAEGTMKSILGSVNALNVKIAAARAICEANSDFGAVMQALNDAAVALENADEEGKAAAQEAYDAALAAVVAQLQALYDATMLLLDYSVELSALKEQADDLAEAYPKAIELVENSYVYEGEEATRQMLLDQMNGYYAAALPYVAQIADAYDVYADDLKMGGTAAGAFFTEATNAVKSAFVDNVYGVADLGALTTACGSYVFDMELLELLYGAKTDKDDDAVQGGGTSDSGKVVVDNNRIVAVTYGTGDVAYKTFILNYNSFAVRVVYNGTIYTIGSGDYVVITDFVNP
ncbi:MAG: hypothetical protein IJW29_05740 [Clostridia bacterium]|nr:hypothetical protein [Clostridia bacterium]